MILVLILATILKGQVTNFQVKANRTQIYDEIAQDLLEVYLEAKMGWCEPFFKPKKRIVMQLNFMLCSIFIHINIYMKYFQGQCTINK